MCNRKFLNSFVDYFSPNCYGDAAFIALAQILFMLKLMHSMCPN